MNAVRVRQNGHLRGFGDKKVDNNQKTRFYWQISRVSGCGNRFLKDRFTKMSAGIIKNSHQTRMKYKKKRVRERRKHGTATIDPAGIRAGRETDPGESGRDRPEFCQNRMASVPD
jgi:hypothetical protein